MDDASGLAALLDSGFSFQQAEEILRDAKNGCVLDMIMQKLADSVPVEEALLPYMPLSYAGYLQDFMRYLPMTEAMVIAAKIVQEECEEKAFLIKGLLYPLGLLVGVSTGVFLFDRTVLPTMMDLLLGFQESSGSLLVMKKVLEGGTLLLFLSVMSSLLLAVYWLSPLHIAHTYQYFAKRFPGCFLVQYASMRFAICYRICLEKGIATRTTLQMMQEMHGRPLTQFIAKELDRSFMAGCDFSEAIVSPYIEPSLAASFRLAMYMDDAVVMLDGYLKMCRNRMERQLKKIVSLIRLAAYGAVGIIIVVVYRVLMLPMSMLQQLG